MNINLYINKQNLMMIMIKKYIIFYFYANLHEIYLLSPIYITISIQSIPDEIIYNYVYIRGFQEGEVSKDNSRE